MQVHHDVTVLELQHNERERSCLVLGNGLVCYTDHLCYHLSNVAHLGHIHGGKTDHHMAVCCSHHDRDDLADFCTLHKALTSDLISQ